MARRTVDAAPPLTGVAASGLALVSGLALALGQPPYDLWPVALVAVAVAFWGILKAATRRRALWLGWLTGLGYFGLSLRWITEPFFVDAAVTGWMAPFALVGMAGGLALFWALAAGLAFGRVPLALVAFWTLAELARSYVLTGFPWGLLGYALAPTPLVYLSAWIGPHGLTVLVLGVAAGLAVLRSRPMVTALGGMGFAALWVLGVLVQAPEQDLSGRPVVRLVQPNAPQHLKWDPAHMPTFFQRQVAATGAPGQVDLIVWSETALPLLLDEAEGAFGVIAEAAKGTPVVLGLQRAEGRKYLNSLALLDGQGAPVAVYDKHHLVPFGEYMPLPWLFAGIEAGGLAARARGGFSAGPGPVLIDTPLGRTLPLICYEAVFPQDILRAPDRPEVLLHLTNDAWFGTHVGPYQHLMQARLRAIETGLPLVRAANTGVSAVIDPGGRILDQLSLGVAGHLDVAVPAALPPTIYAQTGDWPVLILCLLGIALAWTRRRTIGY